MTKKEIEKQKKQSVKVKFINIFLNSSWKIKIIVLLIIAGLFFSTKYLVGKSQDGKMTYQTAVVEKGTLVSSISGSGTVTTSNVFEVSTQATGVVKKVYVEDGTQVIKEQKIAEIDLDLVGSQRHASAYASYLNAQKSVNSANNAYRSSQASLAVVYDEIKGHDSDETLVMKEKRTKAEVANDNAYDATITANAQRASSYLSYIQSSPVITAPATGIIKLSVAEGSQVSGGSSSIDASNTRIAAVVTEGLPIVNISVSEIDIIKVKTGQKATLTFDSIEDVSFTGKVVAVDNLGSTTSGVTNYSVIIKLDDKSEKILPNMAVTADIITDIKTDIVLVPSSAVQAINGQSIVLLMKDGVTSDVVVEIGSSNDSYTQIISGLNVGDEVVTSTTGESASSKSSDSTTSPFSGIGRTSGSTSGSRDMRIMGPGL